MTKELTSTSVIVNALPRPVAPEDVKAEVASKLGKNLTKRWLEDEIQQGKAVLKDLCAATTTAYRAMVEYAEEYGLQELMKFEPLTDLMHAVNSFLSDDEDCEVFTMDTFLDGVSVGYKSYRQELLDDDGLLVVIPNLAVRIDFPFGHQRHDTEEQQPSYHVTVNCKLDDLHNVWLAAREETTKQTEKVALLERKLKNIGRLYEDIENENLMRQVQGMADGPEVLAAVSTIMARYLNGEGTPDLLQLKDKVKSE